MKSAFYQLVANSNAHRKQRDLNCETAMQSDNNLNELFEMAFSLSDENHFKACWTLELVLAKDISLLANNLDRFCITVSKYKNDSAIRSISKICMFLSNANQLSLTKKLEQQLIEACLDWLIQDKKVATKAYAMRALNNFSKEHKWVKDELQTILKQDYSKHSAAYKAAAKDILAKLK